MKRKRLFFGLLISLAFGISRTFAAESLEKLLSGYLSNDMQLRELSIEMKRTLLENEISGIQNGFSFKISTGTITFVLGSDAYVKFTPSLSLALPETRNLNISLSSSILFDSLDSTDTFSNTSLKASIDIISNSAKEREIEKIKTQRKILEAKRNLQNGFLNAETEFYKTLQSLYQMQAKIVTLEKNLYDDKLTLEQLTAQGYRSNSTKYRTASMNVKSDENDIKIQTRELNRETHIFAAKCGVETDFENPADFLPDDIPEVSPVSIRDFSSDNYVKTESAKWTQYINSLEREADSAITLKGNAGFTFNNERTSSHTVDLGSDFTWNNTGLTVSAGANLPVGSDSFTPVFTLGISVDPNAFRTVDLNNQIRDLEIEKENNDITNAQTAFRTAVVAQRTELSNLQWEKSTYAESLDMYTTLEADMAKYYKQGYVTQSEYKSSQVNKENYRIKCIINRIDFLIYNNSTKALFVRDDEFISNEKTGEAQDEKK